MDREAITKANREAWDEVAPRHAAYNQERLLAAFRDPGYICFDGPSLPYLRQQDLTGKAVAQICCNNGRELISLKRLTGAARAVGFDGSKLFIEQARELAAAAGEDCLFHACDAYELPHDYDQAFDFLLITIGVLSWMPDLPLFFQGLARVMRPGGKLFIHEQHPFLEMMEPGAAEDPVAFELSYFTKEPYVETDGLDYYGGEKYDAKPARSFSYKLSDATMAGINAGLRLAFFEERPEHISNTWYNVEASGLGLPMNYIMIFEKSL